MESNKKKYEDIANKVDKLLDDIDVHDNDSNALIIGKIGKAPFIQAKGSMRSIATSIVVAMAANPTLEDAVLRAVNTFLEHDDEVRELLKKQYNITSIRQNLN